MKPVNPWFLNVPLGPLAGLAEIEDEVERYAALDPNDSTAVRKIIRDSIVPDVKSLPFNVIDAVKTSYRYFLSGHEIDFEGVFYGSLPPFAAPDEAKNFFVWIWEGCFPGEDYHINDIDSYVVKGGPNDVNEMFSEARRSDSGEPHA
jgi:hypothetical protein